MFFISALYSIVIHIQVFRPAKEGVLAQIFSVLNSEKLLAILPFLHVTVYAGFAFALTNEKRKKEQEYTCLRKPPSP
jgi:hypothetical protein